MTRIMRDSTTLTDDPIAGTDIVAAYSNGLYRTTVAAVLARFGAKIPVAWIDVNGTNPTGAGILDVEAGDATVAEAVVWVKARLALHPDYVPIIYCNRSTLTPLFNAMNAAGLKVVTHFRLWVATLDGTKTLKDMTGVTAIQYAGQPLTGHHYDESIVYDDKWHAVAPVIPTPPAPQPIPVLHGQLVRIPSGVVQPVLSSDGGKNWH
jgi:hypothetical protein